MFADHCTRLTWEKTLDLIAGCPTRGYGNLDNLFVLQFGWPLRSTPVLSVCVPS